MSGGKASRQKGDRGERLVVNTFQEAGIHAERIPLSGSAGGSFTGDLTFACLDADWRGEVKVRGDGFKTLYGWLAENRALFLKGDRREPLVCLRLSDFIDVVKGQK